MTDRQKNKLYKKSILQIKKLHPKKGDVILAQPNIDELGFDIFMKFLKVWIDADLFEKATLVWAPFKANALTKEQAQRVCDTFQEKINKM